MRRSEPVVLGGSDHDDEDKTDQYVRAPQDVELVRIGGVLYSSERVGDHVEVEIERERRKVRQSKEDAHLEGRSVQRAGIVEREQICHARQRRLENDQRQRLAAEHQVQDKDRQYVEHEERYSYEVSKLERSLGVDDKKCHRADDEVDEEVPVARHLCNTQED